MRWRIEMTLIKPLEKLAVVTIGTGRQRFKMQATQLG
jgi:hypothetical protein